MLIVKLENDQIVDHNNIVEEDSGGFPQFLTDEGWIECEEPTIPQLAEYQELGDIQYIYDSQTNTATATYQIQGKDYSEWGTYKDFVKSKLKGQYMDDVVWTDNAKIFYDKFKALNPSNTDFDTWWNEVITYWNEARTERSANKQSVDSATTDEELATLSYSPTHAKTKEQIDNTYALIDQT